MERDVPIKSPINAKSFGAERATSQEHLILQGFSSWVCREMREVFSRARYSDADVPHNT